MKLITKASVYSLELPDVHNMNIHLAEMPHEELGETMSSRGSFVPMKVTGELVTPFEGGYAIRFRWDEKILPTAALNAEVERRLQEQIKLRGELPRGEMKVLKGEIKDLVLVEMLKVAFVATTEVTAFYLPEHKYLIVPSTSKDFCRRLVSSLIACVGSVKSTTIHVSALKQGLSAKIRRDLEDSTAETSEFYPFCCGDYVQLTGEKGAKITVLDGIDAARQGLLDALAMGFEVDTMELYAQDGVSTFRLTKDFKFKSISLITPEVDDDALGDDPAGYWRHEAAVQCALFAGIVKDLCDVFGYEPPADTEAEPAC